MINKIKFMWAKRRWINCEDCAMLVKPEDWQDHVIQFHGLMAYIKDWHKA